MSIKKVTALADSRTKNRKTFEPHQRVRRANSSAPERRLLRRVFMASKHRADSRSSCRVANFFFGTFFFLAKKKVERPLLAKGKNFIKSSVCLPKKFSKKLFLFIKFAEWEKFYIFPTRQINSFQRRFAAFYFKYFANRSLNLTIYILANLPYSTSQMTYIRSPVAKNAI